MKLHYEEFINTGNMTRKLLASTMDLAVLDTVIKTGKVFEMPSITVGDVTDLENLYKIMSDSGVICPKKLVVINPLLDLTFEVLNDIEDDLILDDLILHVNTADSCIITQDMYNRLLACYDLSTTFREFDDIERIGVYFAQYGLLSAVPVPCRKAVGEITKWFDEAGVM